MLFVIEDYLFSFRRDIVESEVNGMRSCLSEAAGIR